VGTWEVVLSAPILSAEEALVLFVIEHARITIVMHI